MENGILIYSRKWIMPTIQKVLFSTMKFWSIPHCGPIAAMMALLYFPTAHAGQITYNFSGRFGPVPLELQTVFPAAQVYTGTFSLDDGTSDSVPGDPSMGLYFGAISSLSIQIGLNSFGGSNGTFEVYNENPSPFGDRAYVSVSDPSIFGPSPAGLNLSFIRLDLIAPANLNLVTSDEIITSASTLSNFPSRSLEIQYFTPDFQSHFGAFGTIDEIKLASVQEPSSFALLCAGLVVLKLSRRKKE
jgi:hypothetical protein